MTGSVDIARRGLGHLRWRPTRRAVLRRSLVLAASVLVAAGVAREHHSARRLEHRWELTPVAVATAAVEAGETLDRSNVAIRPTPSGMVPAGALESPPLGESAATGLAEGEILLEDRMVDRTAPRATVGAASMRLEPVAPTPELAAGDAVDVLAFDPAPAPDAHRDPEEDRTGDEVATVVARGARVLVAPGDEDHSLTLAVRNDDVTATAAAALGAGVVVVLPGG